MKDMLRRRGGANLSSLFGVVKSVDKLVFMDCGHIMEANCFKDLYNNGINIYSNV